MLEYFCTGTLLLEVSLIVVVEVLVLLLGSLQGLRLAACDGKKRVSAMQERRESRVQVHNSPSLLPPPMMKVGVVWVYLEIGKVWHGSLLWRDENWSRRRSCSRQKIARSLTGDGGAAIKWHKVVRGKAECVQGSAA